MSDLTGPVEAAARAMFERGGWNSTAETWAEVSPLHKHAIREQVLPIVAAAIAAYEEENPR